MSIETGKVLNPRNTLISITFETISPERKLAESYLDGVLVDERTHKLHYFYADDRDFPIPPDLNEGQIVKYNTAHGGVCEVVLNGTTDTVMVRFFVLKEIPGQEYSSESQNEEQSLSA